MWSWQAVEERVAIITFSDDTHNSDNIFCFQILDKFSHINVAKNRDFLLECQGYKLGGFSPQPAMPAGMYPVFLHHQC